MSQGSLLRRILPPLAGGAGALTLVVLTIGIISTRSAVLDRARVRAAGLAAAERDSLERLMRAGDHKDLQTLISQVARNPDVAAARLIDPATSSVCVKRVRK